MKINKIFGFVVPVGKDIDNINDEKIHGSEILPPNKLFTKLTDLFNNSKKDCDIKIRFIANMGKQKNEVREQIINLCNKFVLENCKPLVKSLMYLTDKKIKEGLLFFVCANDKTDTKLLMARFPSEEGITVKNDNGKYIFEVIDDVFLKNSRKYKAVYYQSTLDDFWSGYAVDKQINDNNVKEISNYWVKDFLQSELKLNSLRGSEILAKAVRKTITETRDEQVKEELISVTPLVKNINSQALSFRSFFDKMNLSEKTKKEVLSKIDNSANLSGITFQFNSDIFSENCNYLIKILDTGAIAMAPAAIFPTVWNEEVSEDGKMKYSTEGKKIKTKISNRI
jgi:hypothetical protein